MAAARTMKFAFVGGVWVGVHTADAPTTDEWRTHCTQIERRRQDTRGVLVFTLGGGPSSQQRKELRDAMREVRAPPTAILTGSSLVRGIVTAVNWLFGGAEIAAFGLGDLDRGLTYLEQGGAALNRNEIANALKVLASELAVELPPKLDASLRPPVR